MGSDHIIWLSYQSLTIILVFLDHFTLLLVYDTYGILLRNYKQSEFLANKLTLELEHII